jgi:hypothetical protein
MKNLIAKISECWKDRASASAQSDRRDSWMKEFFWFLVEEYGFEYKGYFEGHTDFVSEKVIIRLEPSYRTPYSFVYCVGEPNFTRLTLFEVLEYLEGKPLNIDFTLHYLKNNLLFLADVVKKHANKINNDIDDWWLPLQKARYEMLKSKYDADGRSNRFLESYKDELEYWKKKGLI